MENIKPMTPKEWVRFLQHIDVARASKTTRVKGVHKELQKELEKLKENKNVDSRTTTQLKKLDAWYTLHLRLLELCKVRISKSLATWQHKLEGGSHV
jgi:hypothetical protein